MIFLEDIASTILIEEGQAFMGFDFITETLGLSWKRMEQIFMKTAYEYSKRRPVLKTADFNGSPMIQMPPNTIAVNAVRYGVLPDYPKYFQDSFDPISFEYFSDTKILKVFPPNTRIKVSYSATLTLSKSIQVVEDIQTFQGQSEVEETLKSSYVQGTFNISSIDGTMVEVGRTIIQIPDDDPDSTETYSHTIANLQGTLGTGTIDLNTREMQLQLVNTNAQVLKITYYPKYNCIVELNDVGDFVFYKLFSYNLLKYLVSAKAMASQKNLHKIDLTEDNLNERVAVLGSEVRKMQKESISFGSLADI